MLSGEIDFMLKCVAPDLTAFQDFIIHELTAAPNVASVKTSLVIRASKHDPGVPIEVAPASGRGGAGERAHATLSFHPKFHPRERSRAGQSHSG